MEKQEIKTIWKLAKSILRGIAILLILKVVICVITGNWDIDSGSYFDGYLNRVIENMFVIALFLLFVVAWFSISNINKNS